MYLRFVCIEVHFHALFRMWKWIYFLSQNIWKWGSCSLLQPISYRDDDLFLLRQCKSLHIPQSNFDGKVWHFPNWHKWSSLQCLLQCHPTIFFLDKCPGKPFVAELQITVIVYLREIWLKLSLKIILKLSAFSQSYLTERVFGKHSIKSGNW